MNSPLIIDCHGHYTTAPKALEDWRNRQIANLATPELGPKPSELSITDDELRESHLPAMAVPAIWRVNC